MADPIGTVGAAAVPADDEFTMVARGGNNFVARMQKLVELRDQQEAAYEQLKLGNDAAAALKRAQAKVAEAEEFNKDANAALEHARSNAQTIINQANKRAADTSAAALAVRQKAETEAHAVRADADAYAKKVKSEADAAKAELNTRVNAARAAQDKATAAEGAAQLAIDKANQAASQADARAKELKSKIDRLNAAIRDVTL